MTPDPSTDGPLRIHVFTTPLREFGPPGLSFLGRWECRAGGELAGGRLVVYARSRCHHKSNSALETVKSGAGEGCLARPAQLDGSADDGLDRLALAAEPARATLRGMVLLAVVELALVTVCVVCGMVMGRRRYFWARVLLGCLLLPCSVLFVAFVAPGRVAVALAWLMLMVAFIAVPAWSCQSSESLPGPSDTHYGGGSGPSGPPAPPSRRTRCSSPGC